MMLCVPIIPPEVITPFISQTLVFALHFKCFVDDD